jgi:hypothetical protein
MRYHLLLLLLIILLSFSVKPLMAQRTLSYYLEQAKLNSPVIKDNKNQLEATGIEADRLKSLYTRPMISLTANYMLAPAYVRDNGKNKLQLNPKEATDYTGYEIGATNGGMYKALLNIDQPLWNAGRYSTIAEQAMVSGRINENNIHLTEHDIEKLVTDQYILCLQDMRQASYVQQLLDIITSQQAVVQKLATAGIVRLSDVTLLNIEKQSQLTALNTYQSAYRRDLMDLNVLCGIPDTTYQLLRDVQLTITPAQSFSQFDEKYRLDSLNLAVAEKVFNLKYKPQVNLFANTGLNATYLPAIYNRFGVSTGINFIMILSDGKQKRLNHQKTDLLLKSTQSYKENFNAQNIIRKNRILGELQAVRGRLQLMQQQLKDYQALLENYKAELIKGQLSVINYTNTLKNVAALERDVVLLETNQQLLINAYNYWNW